MELNKLEEIIENILLNTCVGFSYSNRVIYLTLDKDWSYSEKDRLINEALCDNSVIEAINAEKIMLRISNFEARDALECLYRVGIKPRFLKKMDDCSFCTPLRNTIN